MLKVGSSGDACEQETSFMKYGEFLSYSRTLLHGVMGKHGHIAWNHNFLKLEQHVYP
jgi:hypothetical protein